jgi:hypothetical protein
MITTTTGTTMTMTNGTMTTTVTGIITSG